jgi:hypothetical protein
LCAARDILNHQNIALLVPRDVHNVLRFFALNARGASSSHRKQ